MFSCAQSTFYFGHIHMILALTVLVLFIKLGHTEIDYVSSGSHLKHLIEHEYDLHSVLMKLHRPEEWKIIQKFCDDTDSNPEVEMLRMIRNPLKIYHLIRRYVVEWPSLELELYINNPKSEIATQFGNLMKKHSEVFHLPNKNDLNSAMLSILRLRQAFKLGMKDFTERDSKFNCTLSPNHLYEIGMYAYDKEIFTHAIDFVFEGLKHLDEFQKNEDVINEIILKHDEKLKNKRYEESFDYIDAFKLTSSFLFTEALENIHSVMFQKRVPEVSPLKLNEMDKLGIMSAFESLCSGNILRTPIRTSILKCFNSHPHPYFTLSPVKTEIHNIYPAVIQFHQIITEKQMTDIISEAEIHLTPSRVGGVGAERLGDKSSARISSNTWIVDDFIDSGESKFSYLNKKIKMITRLDTTRPSSVEFLQIASYLPGGQYMPHTDNVIDEWTLQYVDESELLKGDRIATFMLYLNEVEYGGSTVFPVIGVEVKPVQGSALFWYNEKMDGSMDPNMLHAGCPVLHGMKIVGNKWIRSNDQMFIRQCPKEYFPI